MRNLTKRDPLSLQQARQAKAAKVEQLREAIANPATPPEVAELWGRVVALLESDVRQIDQHLATGGH